jgi:hypothetical protein
MEQEDMQQDGASRKRLPIQLQLVALADGKSKQYFSPCNIIK